MSGKIKNFLQMIRRLMAIRRPSGQISQKNELGRMLFAICSLSENKVIVELGTWNGLGSSAIIAKGVASGKQNAKAIGLEIDKKRVKQSQRNLRKYKFFQVIYGRIVEIQELDRDSLNKNEIEWFFADSKNLESAPNVIGNLPDQIDVLLLDGGEFSSFAEYLNLRDRGIKWLILDDVNIRKNKKVLADALESGKFFEVWRSNERNGTAILRNNI